MQEQYAGKLKLVSVPRYMQFLAAVKKLAVSSVRFIKIANNDQILCKVRFKGTAPELPVACVQKFTWQMPTVPDYTYAAYVVPVQELHTVVQRLQQTGSELLYIHDF